MTNDDDIQEYVRPWKGLTELEKAEITSLKWWDWEDTFDIEGFIRANEAKLKEKNTGSPDKKLACEWQITNTDAAIKT